MKSRTLISIAAGALLLIVAVTLALQIRERQNSFRGSEITPSPAAADFTLTQADGAGFHLAEQQGRVVLLYFGYTNCPDYCPATLAKYQRIYQRLGEQAAGVDFVAVSTDPQRDTPQAMAEYVHYVNPAFTGLSGSEDELRPIWQNYYVGQQIVPMEGSALGYTVNHSTRVYVIDKAGNWRLTFPFEMDADDMLHDVQLLLAE
jgi:protein SCO1/2